MRTAYLFAAIFAFIFVMCNGPRLPWVESAQVGVMGLFKGFAHGMIGFSYQLAWILVVGGIYQLWLGLLYWDMDTTEVERWQYILHAGWTAKLLWLAGAVCLGLGIWYLSFAYRADNFLWPAGIASSLFSLVTCYLLWLAFPLYEQVGIDREDLGL